MYTAGQLHRMTYLSAMFITYMYIICSDTVIQRLYVPEIIRKNIFCLFEGLSRDTGHTFNKYTLLYEVSAEQFTFFQYVHLA